MNMKLKVPAMMSVLALVPLLILLIGSQPAMALGTFLTAFNTLYNGTNGPLSTSGTNASCALCHDTTGGPDLGLNSYGNAFLASTGATTAARLQAIEGAGSINVNGGTTNLDEIKASTQPGWTTGSSNPVFDLTGGAAGSIPVPAAIGALDPVANLPPVANAGPTQAVGVGQLVQLNGSASTDPEAHLLTYSWSFVSPLPAGSSATLTNPTTVNPTFTADVAGSFTVQLVVNDGTQNSAPATVTITAAPAQNLPPTANAGSPQTVGVGQLVTLNGSGSSDPEAQPLTYSWSFTATGRPAGSAAVLTNPTTVNPTFTADVAGSFTVQLVVNDGTQNSTNTATVTITAGSAQNLPPVANAGSPQAVGVGQLVTLDGSGSSDPEAQPLTYTWSFVSVAAGSALTTLTNPTAVNPTFTPDVAGNFVVQLVVNDGTQNSTNTATVTIAAGSATNLPPVANAGPNQTVSVGQMVTLDGSASGDPEGHSLTYSWSFVSVPPGSALTTLTNPTAVNPTFTPDAAGMYVVGLVVNDSVFSSTNTANVSITAPPAPTEGLNLDIQRFRATKEVKLGGKPVRFRLVVRNVGKVEGEAPATLVGMQNGGEVYRQTIQVSVPSGKKKATFTTFPPFTPTAAGDIQWTVTIEDQSSGKNTATATTEVKARHRKEDDRERHDREKDDHDEEDGD